MSRTFGNPAVFALVVHPLAGAPEESDASAAATWVSTSIWVGGRNLSKHTHTNEDRVDDGIHWPAIYLARWLVHHWDAFFLTDRWPIPGAFNDASKVLHALDDLLDSDGLDDAAWDEAAAQRDTFVRSHALKAAAAGGLLPDIWLHRDAGSVVMVWRKQELPSVVFHEAEGYQRVPAASFADAMLDFVEWVADRLESSVPRSALLEADVNRLRTWCEAQQQLEQQAERRLAGYIGLPQQALAALQRHTRQASLLEQLGVPNGWGRGGAAADPSESPLACVFRCASPTLSADDVIALQQHVAEALSAESINDALSDLTRTLQSVGAHRRSWEQGYALAQDVRAVLGLGDLPVDPEELLAQLGVRVVDVELGDTTVDGGAVWRLGCGAVVFINLRSGRAASTHGRRMVLAHELCHLLVDRRAAVPLAMLSGAWAPARIERPANAFAAELLLPVQAIQSAVGPAPSEVSDEAINHLSSAYTVSKSMAVEHSLNRLNLRGW